MQKYIKSSFLLLSFLLLVSTPLTTSAACLNLTKNLSLGSKGSNVSALQDFLYPKYFTEYNPVGRGTFGKFTQAAVNKFQAEYNIRGAGIVGPVTRAKIKQLSCGGVTTSVNSNQYSYGNSNSNSSLAYCTQGPKICPDGVTLVIGRGASCIYDSCPTVAPKCPTVRYDCPNGGTIGYVGTACFLQTCPTATNNTTDTKTCANGTTVGTYETCKKTCSNGVMISESESCSIFGVITNPITNPTQTCARDAQYCSSNNSYVTRDPVNGCAFSACPATVIPDTIAVCPSGLPRTGDGCLIRCSDGTTALESRGCATSTSSGAPSVPTNVSITAGNGTITATFGTPTNSGGSPITLYMLSCGSTGFGGYSSPLVLTGMNNGTTYSCYVFAINSSGNGARSTTVNVTPNIITNPSSVCSQDTYMCGTVYLNRTLPSCSFVACPTTPNASNSSTTLMTTSGQQTGNGYICARSICTCKDGSLVGFNQRLNCDERPIMNTGAPSKSNTISETATDGTIIPKPDSYRRGDLPTSVVPYSTREIPAHAGENGGGLSVQAYAVDPTPCVGNSIPTITKLWTHNFPFENMGSNRFYMFGIKANEAISYKFVVPMEDSYGSVNTNDGNGYAGTPTSGFVSISKQPCDFNIAKVWNNIDEGPNAPKKVPNSCYQYNVGPGTPISWYNFYGEVKRVNPTGLDNSYSMCPLEKGGTYYYNYRATSLRSATVAEDGCQPNGGDKCGGLMQFSGWKGVR